MTNKRFRIVITTTLNNNLFHAKLLPLLRSRDDFEVVVVGDRQGPEYERVRWVWPKGVAAWLGRLGGRLPLLLREISHPRTKLVMAYSVMPHGMFAVTFGRLFRRPVFIHYIAGSTEIHFAYDKTVADNRVILASKHPMRLEKIARFYGRKADHVFVPGTSTERFLLEQGYPEDRVTKLHSTIDLERFYSSNQNRDFDVLVSAQLRERKRPHFTLEVLHEVLARRPESRFCWLGDGPMHDEFDQLIDKLQLRPHLTWIETDEVAKYYRRAKIFLLCSTREGMSLACMEAMACGMVPVVSDCGDMSDIVQNGVTGKLLSVDAPVNAYASAVLTYLEDDVLRTHRSQAATEVIRREHSFEIATDAWRHILAPILGPAMSNEVAVKSRVS